MIIYISFLQVSLAKNLFERNSFDICSDEKSNKDDSKHNQSCDLHFLALKFDEKNLIENFFFFNSQNIVLNYLYLKEIKFKIFLFLRNNSPPKKII